MKKSDFKAPQAGRIVTAPQGHYAFVPAPLPPKLAYEPQLVRLLSKTQIKGQARPGSIYFERYYRITDPGTLTFLGFELESC